MSILCIKELHQVTLCEILAQMTCVSFAAKACECYTKHDSKWKETLPMHFGCDWKCLLKLLWKWSFLYDSNQKIPTKKYPHLNLGNWNRIFKTQTRLGKHNDIQISNVCLHNLFNTKQFIFLSSSNLKRAFNLSGICISNFMRLNFIRALKGSFWCLSNAKYNIVGNNKQEKNIISWF